MRSKCVPLLVLAAFLLLFTGFAEAAQLLSDEELDGISASGVEINVDPTDPSGTVSFGFDVGGNVGSGNMGFTNPTTLPSTANMLSALSIANSQVQIYAENFILNLNICAGCTATNIFQQGSAIPITIKVQQ